MSDIVAPDTVMSETAMSEAASSKAAAPGDAPRGNAAPDTFKGPATFSCIDAHTCGNPVRVVAGGGPLLPGVPMAEKRQIFMRSTTGCAAR